MATSKKFRTPTEAFISSTQSDTAAETKPETPEGYIVPAGYKLVRETKSARLQLLVTPTISANLKSAAAVEGISINELCNRIFEEYLNRG